jgi:drug/metabolite transporter (DMT)-like permease
LSAVSAAAASFGPFALVAIRLSLGALVLLPFSWRVLRRIDGRLISGFVGVVVLWAWALLGEPLTATVAVAVTLILAGVALGQRR